MFGVPAAHQTRMIDFLLLPEFSMMAFTASVEPLRAANQLSGRPLYAWRSLSLTGDPVSASNGVVVHPAGGIDDVRPGATLFVCAGLRAERIRDKALFARLRELSRMGVGLGAVCTGARVLARAGLLDGYNCTIHWEHVEGFAEEFPELKITATLFEIDRDRYTCSGGTAPLDMMINGIARDHGEELAVAVAELLLHNLVRHPHDTQRMPVQHRTGISHPKLLAVIAHMEAYIESPVPLRNLAADAGLSPRQLERLFREKMGKTPSRYYLELRLHRARLLLLQTTMPILQIAVACGFTSASHFARCYSELFGHAPRIERARAARVPGLENEPGRALAMEA